LALTDDVWKRVIQAIETAIPEYDPVNQKVSLGRAQKARQYAAEQLRLDGEMLILDAGIGPGTMAEIALRKADRVTVVGLDASATLLNAARERLAREFSSRTFLVRGVFEAVPFRDEVFRRIVSSYAFRDARDRGTAIEELARVSDDDGVFGIVDLGKPNSRLKRLFIDLYVKYLMPLIAKLSMSNAIVGNPWRMIYPTYQALGSNRELVEALKMKFRDVRISEFMLGGVIFVSASKS
jgi:demethylmenaquinone methyltransferase/2-methoxy-6-polyprenyl-1,4-benzoquinol methylase